MDMEPASLFRCGPPSALIGLDVFRPDNMLAIVNAFSSQFFGPGAASHQQIPFNCSAGAEHSDCGPKLEPL